jgi:undecaprenyl-diphosphatase
MLDDWLNHLWHGMLISKHWRWLCKLLKDANRPARDHGQLILCFLSLLSLLLFLAIFICLISTQFLHQFDLTVYHLLRGFIAVPIDKVMVFFTAIAYKTVLLPLIVTVFIYLAATKRYRAAIHWGAVCVLSAGIALAFKHFYFSPRPPGIFFVKPSSSFPSGHATIATAFYGFLAWLICLERPNWKKWIYSLAGFIIVMVILSRIYLGEHWLTDVTAGFFLSTFIAIAGAISYQRKKAKAPNAIGLIIVAVLTIGLLSTHYLHKNFRKLLQDVRPVWSQHFVKETTWWNGDYKTLPSYRNSRFGRPAEILNLQWAGELSRIKNQLKKTGWEELKPKHPVLTFKKLAKQHIFGNFHLLPQLYKDHTAVVLAIKIPKGAHSKPMLLTLWPANILLMPNNLPLWIGSVHYELSSNSLIFRKPDELVSLKSLKAQLLELLHNEDWKTLIIPKRYVPKHLLRTPSSPHYLVLIKPSN